ncbi:MAG: YlxM family DNA-binding protein [Firmicutes bacterium]|nr:YlxM family DNA-binding protein [Bacillota bacterium]
MERLVRTGLLYDFYGGLLTEKQQRVMELYFLENWSLAEIADAEGVSRQAVHDLLQRSEKIIEDFEAKLGLLERYSRQQTLLTAIKDRLQTILNQTAESNPIKPELLQIKEQILQLIESEN